MTRATKTTIADLSDTPQYHIKTVCAQTGLRAVTLRAWERRYQLLTPHRTASNYRLYSSRDVAILRWLKQRIDDGLTISRAAEELGEIRRAGLWPTLAPTLAPPPVTSTTTAMPPDYVRRLYQALIAHDETRAGRLLAEAVTAFDLLTLCEAIVTPCLVEIGEAWHRGDIRIATEHFASHFVRGQLLSLFQMLPSHRAAPRVVVGCAPGERHDIGALMLALLVRRDGYRVEFLGPDVHLGDLIDYAREERPAFICLSANREEAARELRHMQGGLLRMRPRPKFGFGGRAFVTNPALRESVPGIFLGLGLRDGCANITKILTA
jgi:methanogenic corrinoid protein MtbC1